jgi:cell division protein FtsZ
MDRGRMLADAASVLVQVAGGPGMTLSEVEILMQELGRHIHEQTQILFGTAVDGRMGNRLSVTIISSFATDEDLIPQQTQQAQSTVPAMPPVWEQPQEIPPNVVIEPQPTTMEALSPADFIPPEQPVPAEIPPPPPASAIKKTEPHLPMPQTKSVPAKAEQAPAEKAAHAKQEVLQFESVTRGRFEKSEPTIVEGEDLDVPTYLRKNIRVK